MSMNSKMYGIDTSVQQMFVSEHFRSIFSLIQLKMRIDWIGFYHIFVTILQNALKQVPVKYLKWMKNFGLKILFGLVKVKIYAI